MTIYLPNKHNGKSDLLLNSEILCEMFTEDNAYSLNAYDYSYALTEGIDFDIYSYISLANILI